jgi:MraZ protein
MAPITGFTGSYPNRIDEKGRVAIPATLRKQLGEEDSLMVTCQVVVVGDVPVRCLDAWPLPAWQEMVAGLQSEKGAFSSVRELFELNYLGNAQHCQLDRQGRIPIPPKLRQLARLPQDVTFIGSGKKIRIFDAAVHERLFDNYEATMQGNPDSLRSLGI